MARSTRPSPGRRRRGSQQPAEADDAFIARVIAFTHWARQQVYLLVVLGVALVLIVVGVIYYLDARAAEREAAVQHLEEIHQMVQVGEVDEARAELDQFLDRFGGLPEADEGRLLRAQVELQEGNPEGAIQVLEPLTARLRDPLALQGAFLLGMAYEELEQWDEAEAVYLDLADAAELTFQRREALEGAARVRTELERYGDAAELYRRVLDLLEEDDPRRTRFEMKLAEVEARQVAEGVTSS